MLGIALIASSQAASAAVRAASASFTPGGELLHLGEQGLLLLALGLRDERAAGLLLGPLRLEVGDRLPPRGVGRQRPVDHVVGQPTLGLGGAHAVGVVTEEAGVDHARKAIRPGVGDSTRFGHTSRVTPASRNRTLAWAVLAGALFAVLAFLVTQDRAPLDSFDVEGRALEDWADDSAWLVARAAGDRGRLRHDRDDDPDGRCWRLALAPAPPALGGAPRRRGDGGDLARHHRAEEVAGARPARLAGHPRPARATSASRRGTPRPWRRTPAC